MTEPNGDPRQFDTPGPDVQTERMVAIWQSVLGTEDVEPDSHLLDLGGTSAEAVQIRSLVRAQFGKDLELIDFFDHPTPRGLATVVADAPAWSGPKRRPPRAESPGGADPDRDTTTVTRPSP
jgi:acyl carrier protein